MDKLGQHEDDRECLRSAIAGDDQALAYLYTKYRSIILRYLAYRRGGRFHCDAEDIVQEVFIGLRRHNHKIDDPDFLKDSSVACYLTVTASLLMNNRCRGEARRQRRERARHSGPSHGGNGAELPLVAAERLERQLLVAQAVARLPAEHRRAIAEMFFTQGRTTSPPSEAVRSRSRRALRWLASWLADLR